MPCPFFFFVEGQGVQPRVSGEKEQLRVCSAGTCRYATAKPAKETKQCLECRAPFARLVAPMDAISDPIRHANVALTFLQLAPTVRRRVFGQASAPLVWGEGDWRSRCPPGCPLTASTHPPTTVHETLTPDMSYGALVRRAPLLATVTRPCS